MLQKELVLFLSFSAMRFAMKCVLRAFFVSLRICRYISSIWHCFLRYPDLLLGCRIGNIWKHRYCLSSERYSLRLFPSFPMQLLFTYVFSLLFRFPSSVRHYLQRDIKCILIWNIWDWPHFGIIRIPFICGTFGFYLLLQLQYFFISAVFLTIFGRNSVWFS